MREKVEWGGETFQVYDLKDWEFLGPSQPYGGGIFIFAKRKLNMSNGWEALLVGKTQNLFYYVSHRKKVKNVIGKGATHVHLYLEEDDELRLSFRWFLCWLYKPKLNTHLYWGWDKNEHPRLARQMICRILFGRYNLKESDFEYVQFTRDKEDGVTVQFTVSDHALSKIDDGVLSRVLEILIKAGINELHSDVRADTLIR